MAKIILACDLDNTLIYSYKHRTPEDICVEWLEGQEQSFMTAQTIRLLPRLARRLLLLPVTTRSQAQYQRLVWPQGSPEWAITTNGGLLLHKGEVDTEWRDYTLGMAAGFHDSLQRLEAELGNIAGYARRRMVDDMYLYVVCQDKAAAEHWLYHLTEVSYRKRDRVNKIEQSKRIAAGRADEGAFRAYSRKGFKRKHGKFRADAGYAVRVDS